MENEHNESRFKRVWIDFTAGFISGAISNYVGHPLDTIKVRMQVADDKSLKGSFGVLKKILVREGVTGLFKGALPPVLGNAPVNAVLFASNAIAARAMKDTDISEENKVFWGGCFGGFMSWFVTCPMELLKVKRQGNAGKTQTYWKMARSEGVRGLFSAFGSTWVRDVPAFGIFFFTYDFLWKKLCEKEDSERKSMQNIMGKMIAGGIAGQVIWTIVYPLDVIKSYMQYHPGHTGTLKTATHIYHKYGARKFYRGLPASLARAFPVSAIMFISYEESVKLLNFCL